MIQTNCDSNLPRKPAPTAWANHRRAIVLPPINHKYEPVSQKTLKDQHIIRLNAFLSIDMRTEKATCVALSDPSLECFPQNRTNICQCKYQTDPHIYESE